MLIQLPDPSLAVAHLKTREISWNLFWGKTVVKVTVYVAN